MTGSVPRSNSATRFGRSPVGPIGLDSKPRYAGLHLGGGGRIGAPDLRKVKPAWRAIRCLLAVQSIPGSWAERPVAHFSSGAVALTPPRMAAGPGSTSSGDRYQHQIVPASQPSNTPIEGGKAYPMATSDRQQVCICDLSVGCDLFGGEMGANDNRGVISEELMPRLFPPSRVLMCPIDRACDTQYSGEASLASVTLLLKSCD